MIAVPESCEFPKIRKIISRRKRNEMLNKEYNLVRCVLGNKTFLTQPPQTDLIHWNSQPAPKIMRFPGWNGSVVKFRSQYFAPILFTWPNKCLATCKIQWNESNRLVEALCAKWKCNWRWERSESVREQSIMVDKNNTANQKKLQVHGRQHTGYDDTMHIPRWEPYAQRHSSMWYFRMWKGTLRKVLLYAKCTF